MSCYSNLYSLPLLSLSDLSLSLSLFLLSLYLFLFLKTMYSLNDWIFFNKWYGRKHMKTGSQRHTSLFVIFVNVCVKTAPWISSFQCGATRHRWKEMLESGTEPGGVRGSGMGCIVGGLALGTLYPVCTISPCPLKLTLAFSDFMNFTFIPQLLPRDLLPTVL